MAALAARAALQLAPMLMSSFQQPQTGKGMSFKKIGSKVLSNPYTQGALFQLGSQTIDSLTNKNEGYGCGKKYKLSHGLGIAPAGAPIPTPYGGMIGKLYVPPKINWTPKSAPVTPSAPPAPKRMAPLAPPAPKRMAPLAPAPAATASKSSSIINKMPSKMSTLYPVAKSTLKQVKRLPSKVQSKVVDKANMLGDRLSKYGAKTSNKMASKTGSVLKKVSRTAKTPRKVLKSLTKKVKRAGKKLSMAGKKAIKYAKNTGKKAIIKGRKELNKRLKMGSGMNPVIPGPLP